MTKDGQIIGIFTTGLMILGDNNYGDFPLNLLLVFNLQSAGLPRFILQQFVEKIKNPLKFPSRFQQVIVDVLVQEDKKIRHEERKLG